MKNKMYYALALCLMVIMLYTSLVSAEVVFFQDKNVKANGTINNHLVYQYVKDTNDFIKGNNPLEAYIQYRIYPQTWNNDNPSYQVINCTLNIKISRKLENSSTSVFNITLTPADEDIMNGQYFTRLYDIDVVFADEDCIFQNTSYTQLYLPAEMQYISPTFECKACQYVTWAISEVNIAKIQRLHTNTATITDWIYKLVILNFEILLALFWVFLILMVFAGLTLIFTGVYWGYKYLQNLAR
jgi:hypothetical protein